MIKHYVLIKLAFDALGDQVFAFVAFKLFLWWRLLCEFRKILYFEFWVFSPIFYSGVEKSL